jgi:nucleotide-binding universal stress UspA family protein
MFKVLIATDGSKNSELAAWLFARLPHAGKIHVDILHVIDAPHSRGPTDINGWLEANYKQQVAQAEQSVERIAQLFEGADVTLNKHILDGHVSSTIVAKSKQFASDLVVLGAQGHSAIARLLLGSISDFVATHARCSVLVVRDTGLQDKAHGQLRLCVGFDDCKPSRNALQQLGQFGWGPQTMIEVVNVVLLPVVSMDDLPIQLDMSEITNSMREIVAAVGDKLHELTPNVQTHVRQSHHVGLELSDFAAAHKSDIVVVGDTGKGMLERYFLGSVSRSVLRNSSCSVWIMRSSQPTGKS